MRQNPYTGYWMNSNPCPSCAKALAKPGRHRAHQCDGQTIYPSVVAICDCECQAPTTRFKPMLGQAGSPQPHDCPNRPRDERGTLGDAARFAIVCLVVVVLIVVLSRLL